MLERDTQQQQRRSEIVRAAREKSATARYYRAGYCDNTRCEVRDVLVMAKNHLESIGELQCPSCGRRLLPGAHSFGVRGRNRRRNTTRSRRSEPATTSPIRS